MPVVCRNLKSKMKIKIIKSREGLPPVGTVLKETNSGAFCGSMTGDMYEFRINPLEASLALEAGYAEEVKEHWQAWKRKKRGGDYYYVDYILEVFQSYEDVCGIDDCRFNVGNYFHDEATAQRAADRLKEALKEFHKENKHD